MYYGIWLSIVSCNNSNFEFFIAKVQSEPISCIYAKRALLSTRLEVVSSVLFNITLNECAQQNCVLF